MKFAIEWHQRCLVNGKKSLEQDKERLKSLKEDIKISEKRISFYEEQINEAIKKGKDGFDSDKFMKKKARAGK